MSRPSEPETIEDVLRRMMRRGDVSVRQITLGQLAEEGDISLLRLGIVVDAVLDILVLEPRAKPRKKVSAP